MQPCHCWLSSRNMTNFLLQWISTWTVTRQTLSLPLCQSVNPSLYIVIYFMELKLFNSSYTCFLLVETGLLWAIYLFVLTWLWCSCNILIIYYKCILYSFIFPVCRGCTCLRVNGTSQQIPMYFLMSPASKLPCIRVSAFPPPQDHTCTVTTCK